MTLISIARLVFWMTGALVSFSIMAVAIRELHGPLNLFEILAFRGMAGVIVFGGIALVQPGARATLRTPRFGLHLLRNTVHFGATYTWALGLTALPMATVFALEFTMPAWTALLAVLVLGERLTFGRGLAVACGVMGVIIILRPGIQTFHPAALAVLASAFGFACAAVMTKRLTTTESTLSILLYMNLIQLPLNLAGSNPLFLSKVDASMALPIAALCVAGLASHLCMTNAFRSGDAILVVPLDFLRIPLIAVVGAMLYNEPLDLIVFLGATVIVAGIILNLKLEMRVKPGVGLRRSSSSQSGE